MNGEWMRCEWRRCRCWLKIKKRDREIPLKNALSFRMNECENRNECQGRSEQGSSRKQTTREGINSLFLSCTSISRGTNNHEERASSKQQSRLLTLSYIVVHHTSKPAQRCITSLLLLLLERRKRPPSQTSWWYAKMWGHLRGLKLSQTWCLLDEDVHVQIRKNTISRIYMSSSFVTWDHSRRQLVGWRTDHNSCAVVAVRAYSW